MIYQKKILLIASAGGHWTQLNRILPAFKDQNLVFVSTKESFRRLVHPHIFYSVPESSRWDKLGLFKTFFTIFKIILLEKPETIITTGAAPGLMAIIAGKILFKKGIWIDSIANFEEVSMSGKIASKFTSHVYTQWEHLSSKKIHYKGNVLK